MKHKGTFMNHGVKLSPRCRNLSHGVWDAATTGVNPSSFPDGSFHMMLIPS